MDDNLTFDPAMLLFAPHDDNVLVYELINERLRPLAVFYNESDATSIIRMAKSYCNFKHEIESLNLALERASLQKSEIIESYDQLRVEHSALLASLKGMIYNTTVEFAAINGFGEERNKACEVYDRIMRGTTNAGGDQ